MLSTFNQKCRQSCDVCSSAHGCMYIVCASRTWPLLLHREELVGEELDDDVEAEASNDAVCNCAHTRAGAGVCMRCVPAVLQQPMLQQAKGSTMLPLHAPVCTRACQLSTGCGSFGCSHLLLLVMGMATTVTKAGSASVMSSQSISVTEDMKMTTPAVHARNMLRRLSCSGAHCEHCRCQRAVQLGGCSVQAKYMIRL